MKHQYSCGIIPFFKRKKTYYFLCIKQKRGHRGFPKGIEETGESDKKTALREFQEETGIKKIKFRGKKVFKEHFIITEQKIQKTVTFFLGKLGKNWTSEIHLQQKEAIDYFVGTFGEVEDKLTFPEAKQTLKGAYTYLKRQEKKRVIGYLSIASLSFLIFLREIFVFPSLGFFVNKIFTCTQIAYNSFPCYANYDIAIIIGAFSTFTLFLGLRFIQRKRLAK